MGLLLCFLCAIAIAILLYTLLGEKVFEYNCIIWVVILIVSFILAVNGTIAECRDGWPSHSIGRSGACSWHGGVVSRYNDFGKAIAKISGAIIGIKLIRVYFQVKSTEQ